MAKIKGIRGIISRAKKNAKNRKDYDVMNPEAKNPTVSSAKSNGLKALKNIRKNCFKSWNDNCKNFNWIWNSRNSSFDCNSSFY